MTDASGDPVARVPERDQLEHMTEVAVRLPRQLLAFVDELVSAGHLGSRDAVITRELGRLQRRLSAERDAELYRVRGEDPASAGICGYLARNPLPAED